MTKNAVDGGFTLIEILVVILIIGILAAYFGQNIFGQTRDAKLSSWELVMGERIPSALVSFYASHGFTGQPLTHGKPSDYDRNRRELIKRGAPADTSAESRDGSSLNVYSETPGPADKIVRVDLRTYMGDTKSLNYPALLKKRLLSGNHPMIDHIYIYENRHGIAVYYRVN